MNLSPLSDQLVQSLRLSNAPVALGFLDSPPPGVEVSHSAVPSACTFWTQAEKGLFFAEAESHENCPIGALTMGFPLSSKGKMRLGDFVSMMCESSYIGAAEKDCLPRIAKAKRGILYGPLSSFPIHPDLVLIWVNPLQAMWLQEGIGSVRWDVARRAQFFGRPACGALAVSANEAKPTISLGCSGMRTFTSVPDEKLLVSVPGSLLEDLPNKLQKTLLANERMLSFYRQHKEQWVDA